MPTESQLFDPSLRQRIRERIVNGQLPVMIPKQISGGYGSGKTCAACDQPITSTPLLQATQVKADGSMGACARYLRRIRTKPAGTAIGA